MLVIDDQRTFASLLQEALARQPDFARVHAAFDLDTGLEQVARCRPDVVILDVHFAGDSRDGIDVVRDIRSVHPGTRVILLTGQDDPSLVGRAAVAGASALMAKNGSLDDILRVLRTETSGGLTVDPLLLQALATDAAPGPQGPALTPREADVLAMLVLGLDGKTISNHLEISLNTTRSYIKSLLSKLHAHSQLEAVAIARRRGLLDGHGAGTRTGPPVPPPHPRQSSGHAAS